MPKSARYTEEWRKDVDRKADKRNRNTFSFAEKAMGIGTERERVARGDPNAAQIIEARKPKMSELERQKFLVESLRRQGIE